MRLIKFTVLAALLSSVLLPVNFTFAAVSLPKVNFAHATLSARLAPLWLAQEQGIFAKHGIGAEVILVRSGAALIAAIMSGDIHMGSVGAGAALGAGERRGALDRRQLRQPGLSRIGRPAGHQDRRGFEG